MQRILRRRILRDLKSNFFRYLALGLMIILGMYMIVSMVGAADTVIQGVNLRAEENKLEDGEFRVFVPLTSKQEDNLKDKGITLEKMFYLDYLEKDNSTIRVFKNRKKIDLIAIDKGRTAKKLNEVVIEKRYSEEHHLSVGDSIKIDGNQLKIVGIGTVPDYDSMLMNMSDTTVDSKYFGLAFVTDQMYEEFKKSGDYSKSEEYGYAFRLNGNMTHNQLKNNLSAMKANEKDIKDSYFQEYWKRTAGKKNDIKNGINKLADGSDKMKKALKALKKSNPDVNGGVNELFKEYLEKANSELSQYGYQKKITGNNYKKVLQGYIGSTTDPMYRLQLRFVLDDLNNLKEYRDGIKDYTNGVAKSSEGAGKLAKGIKTLKTNSDQLLKQYFNMKLDNLTEYIKAGDNPRIKASSGDQIINKYVGLVAGIIVMILFTYVISVFVIHGIERESSVIGALYALGAKKGDLYLHYLTLPVSITMAAGICGTLAGFSRYGVNLQMQECYTYYSVPKLATVFPCYLVLYGIIMPPLVAAIVNYFVINKRLSQPALKLIRNEQKSSRISNINLGNMGFVRRFQIRQMLREARTGFTVIFGMLISMLVLMIGIDCYVMSDHMSVDNKADTKYNYMYTYKYPQTKVPDGGEASYVKSLTREAYGYNLDVMLLGIDDSNPYFDVHTEKGKNKIVISSSTAQKFNLKKGDKLILEDKADNMDYAFTVTDIVPYSVGLYAFMDIDSMRELFNQKDNYYNVVFSTKKLKIASGRLYAVTTKEDIRKSADVFIHMLLPMIIMLIIVSVIIFGVVMYLMMKVMIDRSAFSISMIKVFGYHTKEIRKLYLNGNFYIIAVGAAFCIPIAKKLIDLIYPYFISNVAHGMNLSFQWQLYLVIYGGIILLYFIINQLLVGRLKKMIPADVLKNRE